MTLTTAVAAVEFARSLVGRAPIAQRDDAAAKNAERSASGTGYADGVLDWSASTALLIDTARDRMDTLSPGWNRARHA